MADDIKDTGNADIIPLSRFRAQLARARTKSLAQTLLDRPDVARYVPTMPVQELFYAIKEVGLHDASELVHLATPAQVQGCLDLDAWQKDEFLADRAMPWLEVLIDAGPAKLARAIDGLDPEVIALYLQRHARVYDLHLDQPPEEAEGHYYPTPDGFFLLDVLDAREGGHGKHVERFVDWLYRADMEIARRVIMSAKWELATDLSEHAYRFRAGRMADLGYVDYFEALEVYRYLDPMTVRVGEGSVTPPVVEGGLPSELSAAIDPASLLAKALERIVDPDELDRFSSSLLQLVNRVMSADLVEPGDVEAAQAALRRTASYLGLALEFLGRSDLGRTIEALRTVSPTRLFRLGFSLTAKLKKAADTLLAHAWLSPSPSGAASPPGAAGASLLDPPHADVVHALRKARPMFPRALEGKDGERPFETLGEIAQAARSLEEAAQIGDFVRRGLGVDPRLLSEENLDACVPGPDTITFQVIIATLAANLLLERPPSLVALAPADLPPLRERALEDGKLRPSAKLAIQRGFATKMEEREYAAPPVWEQVEEAALRHLEEGLLLSAKKPEACGLLLRVDLRN